MVLLGVEGGSIDAFFLSCHPIASISWFHLGILLCWNLFFNFFQIFHFIQLEQFHASIRGSFMTFFWVLFSTQLQQLHGSIWGPRMPFIFPFSHIWPNCNNFMDPLRISPLMIFFFPTFFHSPFHPLATISMGILWKEKNKS
jgi:hypothetical protein